MTQGDLKKIREFRHELHRHPELSFKEAGTSKRLRQFLRDNTTLAVHQRDGWFYAVKEGASPDAGSIAFRADMDALPIDEQGMDLPYASENPGVSHKCGHDGHCAALCALALELESMRPDPAVYLIFQPAEEIGGGAKKAAALIREKNIREVYAFHNLSGCPEGTVLYRRGLTQPASEGLTICFHGAPSHASAPEDGRNPSAVIAETVLYIRQRLEILTAAAGETSGPAPSEESMLLCTVVGMECGTGDFGISAGEGKLMLTLRAGKERAMKLLEQEILTFAGERAAAAGIRISHSISDYFPETRNSASGIEKVLEAARSLHLPAREMDHLWRASEDFGYYLKECDGAMFYIGNGESWPALHTKEYDFNDNILSAAAGMFRALISYAVI